MKVLTDEFRKGRDDEDGDDDGEEKEKEQTMFITVR